MKHTSTHYDLSTAIWHKSSYSGASGGNCVEVATWRKSTYSDASGGNCLEVLDGIPHAVPVRDSKVTDGPAVIFGAGAWQTFVADLQLA
ncbi:DUF397 domain-containing protein [Streptomyces sp. NPDC013181]|uniref:DUF397 domain-containing protein n=1 Tax=Streptomyces sp. NPDC013181 TaxID=3364864 RepID=UPI00369556DA